MAQAVVRLTDSLVNNSPTLPGLVSEHSLPRSILWIFGG